MPTKHSTVLQKNISNNYCDLIQYMPSTVSCFCTTLLYFRANTTEYLHFKRKAEWTISPTYLYNIFITPQEHKVFTV